MYYLISSILQFETTEGNMVMFPYNFATNIPKETKINYPLMMRMSQMTVKNFFSEHGEEMKVKTITDCSLTGISPLGEMTPEEFNGIEAEGKIN